MLGEKHFLDHLYYEIGKQTTNFRLTTTYEKDEQVLFSKWAYYLDAQESGLSKYNQRTLLNNEIVLDIDEGDYKETLEKVKKAKLKYYAYKTSNNRAKHIHLYFAGLERKSKEERKKIRLAFISSYSCDKQLAIDNHMIPIEKVKHWKTGEIKELYAQNEGINQLSDIGHTYKDEKSVDMQSKEVLILLAQQKRREATEVLVNIIKETNHIFTIKSDEKSEIWIYHQGIYIPQGKCFIKEKCRGVLGEAYTNHIINEVISKIEADTYIDSEYFFGINNVKEVAVQNGILNISSLELSNFSPDKIFFNKIPIIYDKTKTCEHWIKHLKCVLKHEEDLPVIQELFGFCLCKEYKYEKAFMFVGGGRNGKGKTLEVLKRFVGAENCSNLQLTELEKDQFTISELFNKMVNIAADIDSTSLRYTAKFKSLTGRDLNFAV